MQEHAHVANIPTTSFILPVFSFPIVICCVFCDIYVINTVLELVRDSGR